MNSILSEKYADERKYEEAAGRNRVALIMHLYFEDLLEESLEYAMSMPENADVYITTDSEEKRKKLKKYLQDFAVSISKSG